MASIPSAQPVTVTTNGQVIILVPNITTKEIVGPVATTSSVISKTTSTRVSGTHVVSSSSALVRSSVHTTLITSARSSSRRGPSVVTQVITSTAPSPTPTGETTTSIAFTRPPENPPPNVPFPVGPLVTSESVSPLETGGVHTPQPEFNGLAASPGVIIGTFAAVIGFGVLCFLACWCRRKRIERRMARAARAAGTQRPPALPGLDVRRHRNSPVWFGRRRKESITELKHLPSESGRSGTGEPSLATPVDLEFPQHPQSQAVVLAEDLTRHSVLSQIEKTHRDPHGDILRTGSVARMSITYHHHGMDIAAKEQHLEMGGTIVDPEKGYEKGFENVDEDTIGLAITRSEPEPESEPEPRRGIPMELLMDHMDDHDDGHRHGHKGQCVVCELEDTSQDLHSADRLHSFIHAR
ncbi:hypothetical protein TWF696_008573 [Orbilia brochopaga]|uniref:Uncharacterized protein n=1 Tax=Orbilia brochopaga TaxID=3140254 RepID=A0AAV9UK74_9PEZI